MNALFDAHLHIINPAFPLIENQGYLPPNFLVNDYLKRVSGLNVKSGVVVSGSFQGFDQRYLVDCLAQLNSHSQPLHCNFVGVTQLPASVSDQELIHLDKRGVRSVRFNLRRGGSESIAELEQMAWRVHNLLKWHVELYTGYDSLNALKNVLPNLPAVCIDHLGLEKQSLPLMKSLLEQGVKVKACGFGRLDFDPIVAIKEFYAISPTAIMFGTDLPSTRAPKPFENEHFERLKDALGSKAMAQIAWENGRSFYGLSNDSGLSTEPRFKAKFCH